METVKKEEKGSLTHLHSSLSEFFRVTECTPHMHPHTQTCSQGGGCSLLMHNLE
jgi:hypothetical protein